MELAYVRRPLRRRSFPLRPSATSTATAKTEMQVRCKHKKIVRASPGYRDAGDVQPRAQARPGVRFRLAPRASPLKESAWNARSPIRMITGSCSSPAQHRDCNVMRTFEPNVAAPVEEAVHSCQVAR